MADYVNLDTIHQPTDGELVPAAWGHGVRENFDALHRPYAFTLIRSGEPLPEDGAPGNVASDSVTEIGFDYPMRSTGDSFTMTDQTVATFTVPAAGYYLAKASAQFQYTDEYTNPTRTIFAALMFKDDTEDSHYLLRRSAHTTERSINLSGMFRAEAGTNLAFVVYQDTGAEVSVLGDCTVIHLGRTLA